MERLFLILWIVFAAAACCLNKEPVMAVIAFLGTITCLFIWWAILEKKNTLIGNNVTRKALEKSFKLLDYIYNAHIAPEMLNRAQANHSYSGKHGWNSVRGKDYIRGKHRGFEFIFSNIELEDNRGEGATVFKGQWIIMKLCHEITSPVRVLERGYPLKTNPFAVRNAPKDQKWQEVRTAKAAFSKQFEVQAIDPNLALDILTPDLIDNILSLDRVAEGVAIGRKVFIFEGDYVHFAIATNRRFFNAKRMSSLPEIIQNDIKYINNVIDVLVSNEALFNE